MASLHFLDDLPNVQAFSFRKIMVTVSGLQQLHQLNHRGVFRRKKSIICSSSSSSSPFWKTEEAPSLIALCQDLDWETRAEVLRQQALRYEQKHQQQQGMNSLEKTNNEEFNEFNDGEWDYSDAVMRLRKQASSQVAETLAEKLDASPDLVPKLASYILNEACKLADQETEDNWRTVAGIMLLPIFGYFATSGIAMAATEATKTAPSWLVTGILGFPVVSYVLFNLYRDKVNPYASITDWIFGMAAFYILGNLVTTATLGVRLY